MLPIAASFLALLVYSHAEELVDMGSWKAVKLTALENKQAVTRYATGFKRSAPAQKSSTYRALPRVVRSVPLPTNFDARNQWPECSEVIGKIRNQEQCGSCWAFATASVVADRVCIAQRGALRQQLSPQDMLSCMPPELAGNEQNLCNGFDPVRAMRMVINQGVVSGGDRGQNDGCLPYTTRAAVNGQASIYSCPRSCSNGQHRNNYANDKTIGLNGIVMGHWYSYMGSINHSYVLDQQGGLAARNGDSGSVEYLMMAEIYQNGPIGAAFTVYEDFMGYRSGVYRSNLRSNSGGHAIKIIGWGVENGVKFWLCANSWSTSWGDRGFFKIVRGENHAGIEDYITALTVPSADNGGGEEPKPSPEPTPTKTYTVKEGDYMYKIAVENGVSLEALIRANPQVKDPNLIFPGQVLVIPSSFSSGQGTTSRRPTSRRTVPANTSTYVVKSGDTLYNIGVSRGCTLTQMQNANPQLRPPYLLSVGQVLNVPRC